MEFKKELNTQANMQEYLMTFTTNLTISTANSIQLQASSLAQMTQATNQLSRAALVRNIDLCTSKIALSNLIRSLHLNNVINYHLLCK